MIERGKGKRETEKRVRKRDTESRRETKTQ